MSASRARRDAPARLPSGRGRRAGGLRDVAEDRHRASAGAPRDHAELHRRQVLRLVDDHVPERARRLGEQRERLVHQRDVVVAPAEPRPGLAEEAQLALVEESVRSLREPRRSCQERADEDFGSGDRPDAIEPAREEPLRVQRSLDLAEVAPGEPAEPRAVVLVEPAQHVHPEALACVGGQPELVASVLQQPRHVPLPHADVLALHARDELLRVRGRARGGGAGEHLGEPDVALQTLDLRTRRRPLPRPRRRARRSRAARRSLPRASAGRGRRTP